MAPFTATFPGAARLLLKLGLLPTGPGLVEVLAELPAVGTLSRVMGPVVDAAGNVLVGAGVRQNAAAVIPTGAAAAVFDAQTVNEAWSVTARAVVALLDMPSLQPGTHALIDAALACLMADDVRRCKFMEEFMWRWYIPHMTANAVVCGPTQPGSPFDWLEASIGPGGLPQLALGEGKCFVFYYVWNWSDRTNMYYLYIRACIKFGSNPTTVLPGVAHPLGMLTLCAYSRWQRRLRPYRVPRASLVRPGPHPWWAGYADRAAARAAGVVPQDPRCMWIPQTQGKYMWWITMLCTNVGRFKNPGGAKYPPPKTPKFLHPHHEDMAIGHLHMMLTGQLGPQTAAIIGNPAQAGPEVTWR